MFEKIGNNSIFFEKLNLGLSGVGDRNFRVCSLVTAPEMLSLN